MPSCIMSRLSAFGICLQKTLQSQVALPDKVYNGWDSQVTITLSCKSNEP